MKQLFNPAGLKSKLAELYALTNDALLVEAKESAADFKTFIQKHFTLATSQSTWLVALSPHAAFGFGCQVAAVLIVKGGITTDELPANPKARPKQLRSDHDSDFIQIGGASGAFSGTGSLHFSWTLL